MKNWPVAEKIKRNPQEVFEMGDCGIVAKKELQPENHWNPVMITEKNEPTYVGLARQS
jgi:hypothetical protein